MTIRFPNHIKIAFSIANFSKDDIYAVRDGHGYKIHTIDGFYIKLLSHALNFSFSLLFSKERGERTNDGKGTGILGMLQRGEADFAIDGLSITENRSKIVDFSSPYCITDITFLTHYPERRYENFAILYTFDRHVWISITVFFFVVSAIFHALNPRSRSYHHVLLRMFASLLEQDNMFSTRSWYKRFIVLTWNVGSMFLSYSYKVVLLSFLFIQPKGIRNIGELSKAVAEGSHACFTYKGSEVIAHLSESHDPAHRVIGESLMENSIHGFDLASFMKIEKPKTVIVAPRTDLRSHKDAFYLSRDSFLIAMRGVLIRKTFCCKKELDKVIRRIFEAGLYEKFLRERDAHESFKMPVFKENIHALTLDNLTDCFKILFSGHILAVTVFIVEYAFGEIKKISENQLNYVVADSSFNIN